MHRAHQWDLQDGKTGRLCKQNVGKPSDARHASHHLPVLDRYQRHSIPVNYSWLEGILNIDDISVRGLLFFQFDLWTDCQHHCNEAESHPLRLGVGHVYNNSCRNTKSNHQRPQSQDQRS